MPDSVDRQSGGAASGDRGYLALLVLINVASQGLLGLLAPLTDELAQGLKIDLRQIGHIQTAFLIAYAVSTPVWADVSSRFSRHALLTGVSVLWALSCALLGLISDPRLFVGVFCLAAVGIAGIVPLTFSMSVDLVPSERRGQAFGWLATAHTLSMGVAFAVGGVLGERFSWRLPFFVFAALGVSTIVALLTWKRYEPRSGAMEHELRDLFHDGGRYQHQIGLNNINLLWRPLTNLWLVCAAVLATVPLGGLAFWMIAMLRHDHGFDAADATLWVIGLFLIQVPGAIIIGKLGDRCARRTASAKPWLLFTLTLLVCPCYLIGFQLSWEAALPLTAGCLGFCLLVLLGAFLACGLPPLWFNAVGDINLPEKRGVVFGMLNFSQLVGRAIGVQLVAWLSATWHAGQISPAIGWLAVLFLPSALCLWPVVRTANRDRRRLSGALRGYADSQDSGRAP